ncbi:hypothetical protein [Inquilinus sp.]|uniref:hypothetical protein n=1 Tax=Inquilinus sp. TaxID=1932117 RepID=UPI0031D6F8BF
MAKALPIVLGLAATVVTGGAAIPGVAAALGISSGLMAGIGVGLSLVGTLAGVALAPTPDKPRMQNGDASIKQALPPRVRLVGRYRTGGYFLYYDSTPDGDLKTLLCHCAHEVDGWEEDWLNDERVQRDSDGNVLDDPWWQEDDDDSAVVIQHYPGKPDQVIPSFDPKWTADHKGHGLCCSYIKYSDLKMEDQQRVFNTGAPPYRAVLRGAKMFDPRIQGTGPGQHNPLNDATWTWTDNAALVVLDYLTRMEQGVPVGFGFPFARIDLASFAAAADVCDQSIPKKGGGTEPRWRAWGAFELTEDRKAVLADFLDACCGRLIQGPDGRIGLTVGADRYRAVEADPFTVPAGVPQASVSLNDDQILEFDFSAGKSAIERINEVRATYVSQIWEWAETEAGIQSDQASIDRNGVESSQIKLRFVPSESQAQRVARYVLKRGNPAWAGKIRGTLAVLDAWGERWVRLTITELGIVSMLFEITSMRIDRTTMTVDMEVTSYDDWWAWTAATDEMDPAIPPPDTDEDNEVPVPQHVAVSIEHRAINGQSYGAVGVIRWDPPPRSVYVGRARYRPLTTPASAWQIVPAEQDEFSVETKGPLIDGQGYEAQGQFLGPRGSAGKWSASALFTAVADPNAPGVPISLTAMVDDGDVQLQVTAPNNANLSAIRFWRAATDNGNAAIDISGPIFTAANSLATWKDNSPGVGDWWYFATSENWSGVQSAKTSPGVLAELAPEPIVILSPTPPGPVSSYDRRPVVSGNGATVGAAIKLYANAVQVGSGTAGAGGAWSVTPSTDLGIGSNSMTATQTVAGNESVASGAVAITVVAIDSDAWAVITAMTTRPPYARQTLIKNLVETLKTAGLWTKMDRLFLLAAADSQGSLLNWKNPTLSLTPVTAGSPATAPIFTTDRGWQGTGSGTTVGGYLDSTFNATVGTNQLAQDSAHLAVWNHLASTGSGAGTFREAGGGQSLIACKNSTAVLWCQANAAAADTPSQAGDGTGFYAWSRQASANYHAYQDTNDLGSVSRTSAALVSGTWRILRGGTGYSNARVAAACWGAGLSGTEVTALRNALHDYLAAIGAAV